MKQRLHRIIISLASNEQQERQLEAARILLLQQFPDLHFTQAHWTEPVNTSSKRLYLNQLCEGTTSLTPEEANSVLKAFEQQLGRTRNEEGIVAIDLDLLLHGERRFHLRDWERNYIKDLLNEL